MFATNEANKKNTKEKKRFINQIKTRVRRELASSNGWCVQPSIGVIVLNSWARDLNFPGAHSNQEDVNGYQIRFGKLTKCLSGREAGEGMDYGPCSRFILRKDLSLLTGFTS